MIRSTQTSRVRQTIHDLQAAAARVAASQAKLSSGRQIDRPEDDPFGAGRALALRNDLGDLRQYQRNVDEGQAWLQASDIALANATGIVQRVRELTVQASNGSLDAASLRAIGTEVRQLREALREQGNATFAGRFLFAGSRTLPEAGYSGPYPAAPPVTYAGNLDGIRRTASEGEHVTVNVPGPAAFDSTTVAPGQNLLATLDAIEGHLTASPPSRSAIGEVDLRLLDDHLNSLTQGRATIGARMNRLEAQSARLQDLELNVQDVLSKTEDADMARTMVEFSTHQAGYQAALQAGAKVIQPSLLDFLR